MILLTLATLVQKIGMSLAIGSSTYAVTFFYKSIQDGTIDDKEKDFLHTVYFVLRIGMGLIILGEVAFILLAISDDMLPYLLSYSTFWFKWGIIATIGANAFLMHKHLMPMGFGPAIAGGSWYMFLIADTLKETAVPFWAWVSMYAMFVVGFWVVLNVLKKMISPPKPAAPPVQ